MIDGAGSIVAAAIVRWVQERGSDTDNVRDASHEASHALEFVLDSWDRKTIDNAILRQPRAVQVSFGGDCARSRTIGLRVALR